MALSLGHAHVPLAAGQMGSWVASGGSSGQTQADLNWNPGLHLVSCMGQDLGEVGEAQKT